MKRTFTIDGKRRSFDTSTARAIAHRTFGGFGDPAGYEETLFRTRSKLYFVFGVGGESSPWPAEGDIRYVSEDEAAEFLANQM